MTDKTITPDAVVEVPAEAKKKKKSTRVDKSILVRMDAAERVIFDKVLGESGFASAGRFIRETIIHAKPQQRFTLSLDAHEAAQHVSDMAHMIMEGAEDETLMKKLMLINKCLIGKLGSVRINAKAGEGKGYDW